VRLALVAAYVTNSSLFSVEHQLGHDHLPLIASYGVTVIRLRVLEPTYDDCSDSRFHTAASTRY
jgi:hypothetical protein